MKLLALIAAFAVGYFVGIYVERMQTVPDVSVSPTTEVETARTDESVRAEEGGSSETPIESVPVPADRLSDGQKRLLSSFGLDPATITVTAAMITCAKEKISSARYEEILAGATPSFNESLSLLACYRQK